MGFIKILLISTLSFSRTELIEFTAKQNLQTLRHFFKQNDSNFYMKGKDTLSFSSNYKALPVLKDEISSDYGVSTIDNQNFLIWKKFDLHRRLSPNKDAEIFLFNSSTKDIERIGKGSYPKFLRGGKYISFYAYEKKQIVIINNENRNKVSRIRINAKSPYFVPSYELSALDNVYYTDINDKMFSGILTYNLETKKRETLYKTNQYAINIDLCSTKDNLYILESAANKNSFANLYRLSHIEKDISKRDFLFQSSKGPAHSLKCNIEKERVYMIKTLSGLSGDITEVVSYDFKSKKAFVHTDLKFVTNLISIEDKLYVPYRKKVYVLDDEQGKFKINKELVESDE
jgi:hypothetical protein